MISWFMTPGGVLLFLLILLYTCVIIASRSSARHIDDPNSTPVLAPAFIVGLSGLIIPAYNIMTFGYVSESTEPWRQIYNNELDAPMSMSYYGKNTFSTTSPLTDGNLSDLRNIYYDSDNATIFIGTSDDASSRAVRVVEIEGDLNNASTIEKIEYRKATTIHRKTAWLTGESEPANYQGDVRITLSNKKDSAKTNSLFGD